MSLGRFIFSTLFLAVLVAFFGLGVAALLKGNEFTNNNVEFVLGNEISYCAISGWYYLGQDAIDNDQPSTNNYPMRTYDENSEISSKTINESPFPRWEIGETLMVYDEEDNSNNIDVIKFVVVVENKNMELPLSISLTGVGINETTDKNNQKTSLCYTKVQYIINDNTTVMYDNESNISNAKCERVGRMLNINNMAEVGVDEMVRMEIIFTRNTASESFEILNNFSFQITAIENAQ